MKIYLLHIVIFFCVIQWLHSQENGVVAFDIPVRNSLKFNRHIINPAFSFVREQNKFISITNKRQWVQFDNAPQTYLLSYSGRFRENIGAGISLFQQDYGVLTTFGGVLNFAYNIGVDRFSNLTFGMNVGFYQSGLNDGKVITNFPDPSLENFPSNSILTINPGINYGLEFFDFGLSINNLVSYNLNTSEIIEEDPEQGIQAHIMYTGYVNSRGFFDESKFSGLVRSEFKKDQTVISGIAMLTVPKGIWAQAGYNSLYGISGGIGLNITTQIALEYNYEKAIGDISTFGSSHEITLAYKFINRDRYSYSGDDDEEALLIPANKSNRSSTKRNTSSKSKTKASAKTKADEVAKIKLAEEAAQAKAAEEARIKLEEETQTQLAAEAEENARIKLEEEAQAQAAEEARIKLEEETQTQLAAEAEENARIKLEEEAQAQAAEEARIKLEEETQTQLAAEAEENARIKLEEEAQAQAAEEARIKLEEETQTQLAAEAEENARIKLEEEAQAQAAEDARIKLEEETQTQLAAEAEENARIKLEEEAKASAEEEARIKTIEIGAVIFPVAKDDAILTMNNLTKLTEDSKIQQQELLIQLSEKVAVKQQDLDDLKEENDLSEQGIYSAPKAFKSVSAENAAIEKLKLDLDNLIKSQDIKISEIEDLYNERLKTVPNKNEEANKFYQTKITELKSEQLKANQTKENLESSLDDIELATDFERKRRIKRAAYDNEQDRYENDRASLNQIKQFTELSATPLTEDDLDFGQVLGSNIQIVKDVANVESGYYLVIAVHTDIKKRDKFLTKVVSAGEEDIDFFYDVNTSKYYIYNKRYDSIQNATIALESKENEPYNSNMSMVKIEN